MFPNPLSSPICVYILCKMQVGILLWDSNFYPIKVGMEISERGINRKQIRQPVCVPFDWEEKPGIPKKDWKPSTHPAHPIVPLPPVKDPFKWEEEKLGKLLSCFSQSSPPPEVEIHLPPEKLITSVPFKWEEKPGKPLPCFFQVSSPPPPPPPPPPEVEIHLPPGKLVASGSHPVYSDDNDDGNHSFGNDSGGEDEHYGSYKSDLEASGFETDESFCSASSLLVGASFLECLFPLLSPKSSFLEKMNGYPEKCTSYTPRKVESKDFDCESNCSLAVRRPRTLGELIMMSRRRSYQRKAIQMRRKNLSAESIKTAAIGCCFFGSNNRIERLQRNWKQQLGLKLM